MGPSVTRAPLPPGFRGHSGQWLANGWRSGSFAMTQSRLYATLMMFERPTALDRIGANVNANIAATVIRQGAYADDGTGWPGALLFDAGTIDAATTGAKSITIAQNVPSRWWLVQVAQGGAPSVQGMTAPLFPQPFGNLDELGGGLYIDGITGALPATFGTPSIHNGLLGRNAVRVA